MDVLGFSPCNSQSKVGLNDRFFIKLNQVFLNVACRYRSLLLKGFSASASRDLATELVVLGRVLGFGPE